MAATATESRRDWMDVSREITDEYRAAIEEQIVALEWTTRRELPMSPALAIRECIAELRIPKVSKVAINGTLTVPDGPEESAYYSIYGIEGRYANGRVRLYVLDRGSDLLPLCADFWPAG